jgi:hypothetical protein
MPPPLESKEQLTDEFSYELVPIRIRALLEEIEPRRRALKLARNLIKEQERDDYEALEEAQPTLSGLTATNDVQLSRQKRAMRSFMNLRMIGRHNSNRNLRSVEPRIESDIMRSVSPEAGKAMKAAHVLRA